MVERSISGADLLGQLPAVLAEIAHRDVVFLVHMGRPPESRCLISGLVGPDGEVVFALGPPDPLGRVFGLIDEEYGWPRPIQVADVRAVADLMPGRRDHPLVFRGDDCLALSISIAEYHRLRQEDAVEPDRAP
jgi:hypothetical protein